MYEDVLIATDGTDGTDGAVTHGLSVADAFGATVHVLHVVDLGPANVGVEGLDAGIDIRHLEQAGEEAVAAVAQRAADRGVEAATAVERGRPAKHIVTYAEKHGVDLTVVGAHGKGVLARFLLGSVSEKVFRTSRIPVLTVRPAAAHRTDRYDDVLVATDGSPGSTPAVEQALELAAAFDATLHAVYVVDEEFAANVPLQEVLSELGAEAVRDVAARGAAERVTVEEELVTGSPHQALLDYVEERGVDLVAMGTHGRTGLERLVTGSVAERVVRGAPVPVLTVRRSEAAVDGD